MGAGESRSLFEVKVFSKRAQGGALYMVTRDGEQYGDGWLTYCEACSIRDKAQAIADVDTKCERGSHAECDSMAAIGLTARAIINGKLSNFPDHGASDAAVKHTLTGEELETILDALADQAVVLDIAKSHITRLTEAARAVINRWDSPQWKWDQHTGVFIAELRAASECAQTNQWEHLMRREDAQDACFAPASIGLTAARIITRL